LIIGAELAENCQDSRKGMSMSYLSLPVPLISYRNQMLSGVMFDRIPWFRFPSKHISLETLFCKDVL